MKKLFLVSAVLSAAAISNLTYALPIVSYTASGSEGNYTLDFTVENTIDASYNQSLYFFGVNLLDTNLSAPEGWSDWGNGGTWNNSSYGGSDIDYQSAWITGSGGQYAIESGESLSGFTISSAVLPVDLSFYAFGTGNEYYENDAFYKGWNPGFEGEVNGSVSVSEPGSIALLALGIAGLGFSRRIKKS